jgi:hypothetical protein
MAVQIREVLLQQKSVSGAVKPLGSVSPLSRQVCMLSVARTATENVRVLNFLENNEIVFHLAAMTQCEQGGEGHIWDSSS